MLEINSIYFINNKIMNINCDYEKINLKSNNKV